MAEKQKCRGDPRGLRSVGGEKIPRELWHRAEQLLERKAKSSLAVGRRRRPRLFGVFSGV